MYASDRAKHAKEKLPTVVQPAESTAVVTKDSIYKAAEIEAFKDRMRVALAKQILDNTAFLSAEAEECFKRAPGGIEEYRKIIRTYSTLALINLIGGDGNDGA